MKVKKNWKKYVHQIALTCLLICSVVHWVPESVYADYLYDSSHNTNHYKYTFNTTVDNKPYSVTYDLQGTSPIFLVEHKRKDITRYYFVSEEDWTGSKIINEDGTVRSFSINAFSNRCDKWGAFYQSSGGDTSISGNPPRWVWDADKYDSLIASGKSDACSGENYELHYNAKLLFAKNKYDLGDLVCEVGDGVSGSVDNPIEDSEIGTIIIPKYRFQGYYRDSENENDCDFTFQWKNKTSTGFSLSKNKYAHTVIQCRVQSRCVVYKDLAHKQILKEFKNFGESAILYNSINVENNPYSIAYSYIKEKLPETMKEIHNPLYVGYEYRFFFRVMCSDDLAVIPGNSGKWYAGGWRSVDLNASAKNEQNPNTSNGHFDDDGNWVTDKDDGNNSTDGGSTVSKDKDDARDDFANGDGKTGDSISFDWNSFKGLINQCKEVPGLIKSVFSFLPDWVLAFMALAFGVWAFVLIKRAIV